MVWKRLCTYVIALAATANVACGPDLELECRREPQPYNPAMFCRNEPTLNRATQAYFFSAAKGECIEVRVNDCSGIYTTSFDSLDDCNASCGNN